MLLMVAPSRTENQSSLRQYVHPVRPPLNGSDLTISRARKYTAQANGGIRTKDMP